MNMHGDLFLCVGKILKPHGLQGFIKVESFTQKALALFEFPHLFKGSNKTPIDLIAVGFSKHDNIFIAKIDSNISSRTEVENFQGDFLFITRDALPHVNDSFYHYDLLGMTVLDTNKDSWGFVSGIHNFGAGDILEVSNNNDSFFLPLTQDAVIDINTSEKWLCVRPFYLQSFGSQPPKKEVSPCLLM